MQRLLAHRYHQVSNVKNVNWCAAEHHKQFSLAWLPTLFFFFFVMYFLVIKTEILTHFITIYHENQTFKYQLERKGIQNAFRKPDGNVFWYTVLEYIRKNKLEGQSLLGWGKNVYMTESSQRSTKITFQSCHRIHN